MKSCSWCLWLGDERIYNIRQLRENFDTAVITGYYLGGGLERWLADAEENAVLEKVRTIDRSADIGTQLEFIFGVRPERRETAVPQYSEIEKSYEYHEIAESVRLALAAVSGDYSSFVSSFGSFMPSSFRSAFEWEFEKGSFRTGSFRTGSFRLVNYSFGKGSFSAGSFKIGSLHFGSGGMGSFRPSSMGSFRFYMGNAEITHEEYKRTKINLSSCPLNASGSGIHRI